MATERDFTGVFIPVHIWESKSLIPAEKMILGEIDCLSKKTGWCTAGRKHFAEWLNCSLPNVSYYFTKLKEAGYIEIVEKPGYSSKYRIINDAFYAPKKDAEKLPEVVNEADPHPSAGLTGVVNGIDGGSKRGLPEIQYKDNNKEREGENETNPTPAPAPHVEKSQTPIVEFFNLEEKPLVANFQRPAAAAAETEVKDAAGAVKMVSEWAGENHETIKSWYDTARRKYVADDFTLMLVRFCGFYANHSDNSKRNRFLFDPVTFVRNQFISWLATENLRAPANTPQPTAPPPSYSRIPRY